MRLRLWLQRLIYRSDVLCTVCGAAAAGEALCSSCREMLARCRMTGRICSACGQPLTAEGTCPLCARGLDLHGRSVWLHEGLARDLVHLLKYKNRRDAAIPLAQGMAEVYCTHHNDMPTAVTWVPMPPSRFRQRQYDHAQLLAEHTAACLKLPLVQALTRVESDRPILHQVGSDAGQRLANLRGTFACTDQVRGSLLLIDDVLTTGATASIAAACLKQGGAERVWVLTATRSPGPARSTEGGNLHV